MSQPTPLRVVGEEVEALWDGDNEYYEATIDAINSDGTYRIIYDDGDVCESIKEERIRDRGLMTLSSSSEGFEDDSESQFHAGDSEEDIDIDSDDSTVTPLRQRHRLSSSRNSNRKTAIKPVFAEIVMADAPDITSTKRQPKKRAAPKEDLNPKQTKKPRPTKKTHDDWDEISNLKDAKTCGRALEAKLAVAEKKLKEAEINVKFLEKQLKARDKFVETFTTSQISELTKTELMEAILTQTEELTSGSLRYETFSFSEEAFITLFGEGRSKQAKKVTTYQLSFDATAVPEFFGRSFCDGLSLNVSYSTNTNHLKVIGKYPRQKEDPGNIVIES